jgi:hypothetical protein
MPCPEYDRLRLLYEAALRQWGLVLFAPEAHRVGTEARQKALDERNAAKERLRAHRFSCTACTPPKVKRIRGRAR